MQGLSAGLPIVVTILVISCTAQLGLAGTDTVRIMHPRLTVIAAWPDTAARGREFLVGVTLVNEDSIEVEPRLAMVSISGGMAPASFQYFPGRIPPKNRTDAPAFAFHIAREAGAEWDSLGVTVEYGPNPAQRATMQLRFTIDFPFVFESQISSDSLTFDPVTGDYRETPLVLRMRLANRSGAHLSGASLTAEFDSTRLMVSPGGGATLAFDDITNGTDTTVLIPLFPVPQADATVTAIRVTGRIPSFTLFLPEHTVILPAVGTVRFGAILETSCRATGDTLRFVPTLDDYRDDFGTRSVTGRHNVFLLTARLTSTGSAAAYGIRASLSLPEDLHLDSAQTSASSLLRLRPDSSDVLTWRIRPDRATADRGSSMFVRITASNALTLGREHSLIIEGTGKPTEAKSPGSESFVLGQNYPNPVPMGGITVIPLSLARREHVVLTVHDMMGREIRRVIDAEMDSGDNAILVPWIDLPPGMLIYRCAAAGRSISRVMALVP